MILPSSKKTYIGLCSPNKCHLNLSSVVANAVNFGAFSMVKPNSFATVAKLSLITFTHSGISFSFTSCIIVITSQIRYVDEIIIP